MRVDEAAFRSARYGQGAAVAQKTKAPADTTPGK